MATVYLGLGANAGNREANLCMALRGLRRMSRIEAVSSLYESEPQGPAQPPYYNAVCRIETGLEPASLLRFLKNLEREIGRRPGGPRWGPRPVDLDILLYNERVVEEKDLIIPHPRLPERAFVLLPLVEIAPEAGHPPLGKTAAEIAKMVDASGVRRIAAVGWDGVEGADEPVRL